MSDLQDDKKALDSARKNRLRDAEAPLVDQIPLKLAKKLDEMNFGQTMAEAWAVANANRQERLQRNEDLLRDWDEFIEPNAEGPFEGASTLHLPMSLIVCKTVHARFLTALLGIDPYFTAKPRREDSVERAQLVQELMGYSLKDWCNYGNGVDDTIDGWVWDWCTQGTGILKERWAIDYTSFVDVVMEERVVPTVVTLPDGREQLLPRIVVEEKEKRVTKKCFDGPIFELVKEEDFVMLRGEGDPQRADVCIHRYHHTASEMWQMVDRAVYREDIVREIIDGGPDSLDGQDNISIKQQKMVTTGIAQLDLSSDLARYEILECYARVDVEESGINSEVLVWVHKRSKKIVRATYLHRVHKNGKRPFFKADFHKRAGQDQGVGLIELLHPLATELDAMHNLAVDYGMISTMPFGFYRPSSTIEPEVMQLSPGSLIPVDDPQRDVFFPNLGNRTSFGMQQESSIMSFIERLTGISDLNLGIVTGAQGATRTATGARALLGEANSNLDVFLRRLNRAWKGAVQFLFHMLQQRIPDGLSFRVTGESGGDYWGQVKNKGEIEGEWDFEIAPNSANSNRLIQQENAAQVLQFVQNPLLIQTGVVNVSNVYEASKNYLRTMGIKDYSRYISKPQGSMHMMEPKEEANRILNGMPVPVTPEMDHQGYIDYWQEIYKSDELLGQFNQTQTMLLASQAEKHGQMLAALQQAQAQAMNARQMQMNSRNSAEQANPAQNPMGPGAPMTDGNQPPQ